MYTPITYSLVYFCICFSKYPKNQPTLFCNTLVLDVQLGAHHVGQQDPKLAMRKENRHLGLIKKCVSIACYDTL